MYFSYYNRIPVIFECILDAHNFLDAKHRMVKTASTIDVDFRSVVTAMGWRCCIMDERVRPQTFRVSKGCDHFT